MSTLNTSVLKVVGPLVAAELGIGAAPIQAQAHGFGVGAGVVGFTAGVIAGSALAAPPPRRYYYYRPRAYYILPSRDRADVAAMQRALAYLGLYAGTIDGIAGGGTRTAIVLLQRREGWAVTGGLTVLQQAAVIQTYRNAMNAPGGAPDEGQLFAEIAARAAGVQAAPQAEAPMAPASQAMPAAAAPPPAPAGDTAPNVADAPPAPAAGVQSASLTTAAAPPSAADNVRSDAEAFFAREEGAAVKQLDDLASALGMTKDAVASTCTARLKALAAGPGQAAAGDAMTMRLCRTWAYATRDASAMYRFDRALAQGGDADASSRLAKHLLLGHDQG